MLNEVRRKPEKPKAAFIRGQWCIDPGDEGILVKDECLKSMYKRFLIRRSFMQTPPTRA